jgi:hypothetical protein
MYRESSKVWQDVGKFREDTKHSCNLRRRPGGH